MPDYLDRLLQPDDSNAEASPYVDGADVGMVVSPRAKSSAELEADETRMLAERIETEFREPGALTIADYEQAKAAGLLSDDDELLVLADLMTRITYR
jgi:hypothetical protein